MSHAHKQRQQHHGGTGVPEHATYLIKPLEFYSSPPEPTAANSSNKSVTKSDSARARAIGERGVWWACVEIKTREQRFNKTRTEVNY